MTAKFTFTLLLSKEEEKDERQSAAPLRKDNNK